MDKPKSKTSFFSCCSYKTKKPRKLTTNTENTLSDIQNLRETPLNLSYVPNSKLPIKTAKTENSFISENKVLDHSITLLNKSLHSALPNITPINHNSPADTFKNQYFVQPDKSLECIKLELVKTPVHTPFRQRSEESNSEISSDLKSRYGTITPRDNDSRSEMSQVPFSMRSNERHVSGKSLFSPIQSLDLQTVSNVIL